MTTVILVGNPHATETANVDILIGGILMDNYQIPPNGRVTPVYPGVKDGPVQVISKPNGNAVTVDIFASERSVFGANRTSFNEVMGYPADQFTNEYWFTWYDSVYMDNTVVISRP